MPNHNETIALTARASSLSQSFATIGAMESLGNYCPFTRSPGVPSRCHFGFAPTATRSRFALGTPCGLMPAAVRMGPTCIRQTPKRSAAAFLKSWIFVALLRSTGSQLPSIQDNRISREPPSALSASNSFMNSGMGRSVVPGLTSLSKLAHRPRNSQTSCELNSPLRIRALSVSSALCSVSFCGLARNV